MDTQTWHTHNKVKFYLTNDTPNIEECRFIVLKVIEQAVRDYIGLFNQQDTETKKEFWETARDFIYDESYVFFWGDNEITSSEFLEYVNLDIDYLRRKTTEQFKKEHNGKEKRNK